MLTSNTFKVDNHLDEVSYCKYLASQHIIFFKQDSFFVDLFMQLIRTMKRKVDEMTANEVQDDSQPSWYLKYCNTLVNQLVTLLVPLKLILQNAPLEEGQPATLLKDYI